LVPIEGGTVAFTITAGPPAQNAPKGLPLYGEVTYTVRCSRRQYDKGRTGKDDHSDLVIEGYQEPRLDPASGRLTIAVVAMSLLSKRLQDERTPALAVRCK